MEEKTGKSIGEYLKSVREEKNLMISKLSEKTCISEQYIRDIENDKFDDMGGVGYAKAITMTYAKALGANDKLVLHLFNSKYTKPVPISLYRREQQPRRFMIPTSLFSILLLAILLVVVVVVITKLYKSGDLVLPFRQHVEQGKVEKVNILQGAGKNAVSLYDGLEEEKGEAKKQQDELVNKVKAVQIDTSTLLDSTDYTDKYLFKGKDSPYNVKE